MPDLFEVSLAEMIKDAEREVAMRRRVYPGMVSKGTMKLDQADRRIAIMEKIVETLKEHATCSR